MEEEMGRGKEEETLQSLEPKVPAQVVGQFLEQHFGSPVEILDQKRLGRGFMATGYRINFRLGEENKTVVVRTMAPFRFSHDYLGDRARSFLIQHQMAQGISGHVRSLGVGGWTEGKELVPIDECKEVFQVVELVRGKEYTRDLEEIAKRGKLTERDKKRILLLSDFLVDLHSVKFSDQEISRGQKALLADSMYKRHTGDYAGSEMLMGVLDTYPNPKDLDWTSQDEIVEIISLGVAARERIKYKSHRLSRVHCDFHPGNTFFEGDEFELLDASRAVWGEPADDFTCMAINYLWSAILHKGKFSGPFEEAFRLFWDNYLEKTGDKEILETAGLFFGIRGVIVAHPIFFDFQSGEVRRKLFNFTKKSFQAEKFEVERINQYLQE